MFAENLLPDFRRAIRFALDPAPQSRNMRALARRRTRSEPRCLRGRHFGDRHRGLFVAKHGKIALQAMCQAKIRIGFEHRGHALWRVRAIAQIAGQRMVERVHRCGRSSRHLQPVSVPKHPCPRLLTGEQHATVSRHEGHFRGVSLLVHWCGPRLLDARPLRLGPQTTALRGGRWPRCDAWHRRFRCALDQPDQHIQRGLPVSFLCAEALRGEQHVAPLRDAPPGECAQPELHSLRQSRHRRIKP